MDFGDQRGMMKYNTAEGVITDDEGLVLFTVHSHKAALNAMQFKPGVAYMPVPRCETCGHWEEARNGVGWCGVKREKIQTTPGANLVTAADFGCTEWKEKS